MTATPINMTLYRVLLKTGATEAEAEAAAAIDTATVATKADLQEWRALTKADLADLETRIIKWNVATIIAMTAIFAAIVKLT